MSELVHYRFLMSPWCARVDAVLRWKGLPYRAVEVHPVQRTEVAFAPSRAVPVLKDGERVIEGTAAILRHLDERAPAPRLYPESRALRVRVEELERWAETFGPPMMWAQLLSEPKALGTFLSITAHHAPLTPTEKFAAGLALRLPVPRALAAFGPEGRLRASVQPLLGGKTPGEAVRAWYQGLERVAEGPAKWLYLLGDEITAADWAVFSFPLVLHRVGAQVPGLSDYPSLAAWFQRIHGDSGDEV